MSLHELVLGGLPIDGVDSHLTDEGWLLRVKAAAHGTTFGTAEAVMSVVDAMGADGGQARIERWGNAVSTIQLQVLGVDATALAKGEAAIRRVLPDGYGAPVDLLWRPPDGEAPASVRTVLTGVLGSPSSGTEWDSDELRLTRTFPLELTHEPHVRSEHLTVTPALPVGEVTVIDDCTSATGWSATDIEGDPITPTVVSGAIHFEHPAEDTLVWRVQRPGSINFAPAPWLTVDAKLTSGEPMSFAVLVAGTNRFMEASQQLPSGMWRFLFDMRGVGTKPVGFSAVNFGRSVADTLVIDQMGVSITRPAMGKQIRGAIEIGGTERTPGTLTVSARDGVSPTGLTLVHTAPDDGTGYDPDLNRWVFSGPAQVDDVTAPMGGWRTLTGYLSAVVPWDTFPAATSYQIGALVRSDTTQEVAIEWSAWSWIDSVLTQQVVGERILTLEAEKLTWVPMGRTTLPAIQARRGGVGLGLNQTAGAPVKVGGWYAFRADRDSALTVVTSDKPRLFIEAGDGGGDPGGWMVGNAADGSDAYTPRAIEIHAPGVHTFPSGRVATYIITAGIADPAVAYTYYQRWTANAADPGDLP